MRRLVDRSRTGGRRTGWQNHRCRSTGEDRGNGGQLYREVANNNSVPQRAAAAFGAGEMLRALDRADEAIRAYRALENDPRFGISARLRETELFIAKQESVMAKRILDGTQTKIATDKRQKRLL